MSNQTTEVGFLEFSRVALQGPKDKPEIAAYLSALGYTTEKIAEGDTLLENAENSYETNFREDNETRDSYKAFSDLKNLLNELYTQDRKIARVIFRKEPTTLQNLGLDKKPSRVYVQWMKGLEKFYDVTLTSAEVQSELAKLNLTVEKLTANKLKLAELKAARTFYLQEEGESQQATKVKDAAIAALSDWMIDYKAVAKIALEDKPQLLESMGIFVRS